MARRTVFEELPINACFAFSSEAKQPTRRKVSERSAIIIPGGKRPLHMDDVETRVHAMACPISFGRRRHPNDLGAISTRCEVFATAKPRAKRMEYAGSFASCADAKDYAEWLRKSGHKARVKRRR